MVAAAEFIFMGNGVDDRIQAVNIRSHTDRFFFKARINFWDRLDGRVDRLGVDVNLVHEIGEGLNPEGDPFAKIGIGEIPNLHIFSCIEARFFSECRDGIVIKTRPRIFPAVEVRHPVGNVHVDAINSGSCDLPYTLHINLAPRRSVGTDPYIFLPFGNPEGGASAKNGGSTTDFSLEAIWVLFGYRLRSFFATGREAIRVRR